MNEISDNEESTYTNIKPGVRHIWRNPDNSYHALFHELDLTSIQPKAPGIIIISDRFHRNALAKIVKDLKLEVSMIMARHYVHWKLEHDPIERKVILAGITHHPIFVG